MKVEVWCDSGPSTDGGWLQGKCVFRGELDAVPAVGEHIVLDDECAAELVRMVFYEVPKNLVSIRIGVDREGLYPEVPEEQP